MNGRIAAAACAVGVVGGAGLLAYPQHAGTVGRLGAVTLAVVVGTLVLGAVGPFVSREVPATGLDAVVTHRVTPLDPHGLRDARRDLDRPTTPGMVPAPVWDRLTRAAALRLQPHGIDLDDERGRRRAEALLDASTWRLLAAPPPTGTARSARPTAALVDRVLDELDALERTTGAPHGHR